MSEGPIQRYYYQDVKALLVGGPEPGTSTDSNQKVIERQAVLEKLVPQAFDAALSRSVMCEKVVMKPIRFTLQDEQGDNYYREIVFFVPNDLGEVRGSNFVMNELMGAYREISEIKRNHRKDYEQFRRSQGLRPIKT